MIKRFLYIKKNLLLAIVLSLAMVIDASYLAAQNSVVIDTSFIFSKRKDVSVFWVYLEKGDSINLQLEIGEGKKVRNIAFFQKISPLDTFRTRVNQLTDLLDDYELTLSGINSDEYLAYTSFLDSDRASVDSVHFIDSVNNIRNYVNRFNHNKFKIDSFSNRLNLPLADLVDSLTFLSDTMFSIMLSDTLSEGVFVRRYLQDSLVLDTILPDTNIVPDTISISLRGGNEGFSELDSSDQHIVSVDSSWTKVIASKRLNWRAEQEEFELWLNNLILLLADSTMDKAIFETANNLRTYTDTSYIDSISLRRERLLKYLLELSPPVDSMHYAQNGGKVSAKWSDFMSDSVIRQSLFLMLNNNPAEIKGLLTLIKDVVSAGDRKMYLKTIKEYGLKKLKVKGGEIIASKAKSIDIAGKPIKVNNIDGNNIKGDLLDAAILNSSSLLLNTGGSVQGTIERKIKNDGIYEIRIINKGWFKKKKKTGRLKVSKYPSKDSIEYIKYDTNYTDKDILIEYFQYIPKNDTQKVYLPPQLNYLEERTHCFPVSLSNKESGYWGFWYGYTNDPSPVNKQLINPLFLYVIDSTQELSRNNRITEISLGYIPDSIDHADSSDPKIAVKDIIKYRLYDGNKPFHDNYGYIKTPIDSIKADSINFEMCLSTTNLGSGRNVFIQTVFAKELRGSRPGKQKIIKYLIPVIAKRPKKR